MTILSRKQLSELHAVHPQPGDYWQDHMCGVLVVLAVDESSVTFCKDKINEKDGSGWTWDLTKVKTKTRLEFLQSVRYDYLNGYYNPSSSNLGCWASVEPQRHLWAVEEWKDMQRPYNPLAHLTA